MPLENDADLKKLPSLLNPESRKKLRERLKDMLTPEDKLSPGESKARGKELRNKVTREEQGKWAPPENRPDPIALLEEQGKSRLQDLLPLRYERMAQSAFTFYRGSALIMASDLSYTPTTGITVQACGDAHISNFGFFNSPERRTVFDINDFDETLPGPWEWDVKRLAASVEICGRDRGLSQSQRDEMVLRCARGYREGMRTFAKVGNLQVWYARLDMDALTSTLDGSTLSEEDQKLTAKAMQKAKQKNSTRAIAKLTEVVDGRLRVRSDPPLVVPIRELYGSTKHSGAERASTMSKAELIGHVLAEYRLTLAPDKRHLIEQYEGVDIARKVVGVGSVGTRAWIIVMRGASNDDPLVLQVKEAQESVLERFVGKSKYLEHGRRVVEGQRAMQSASDPFLGWCRLPGEDGVPKDYYVRQLWDGKGSFDLERLTASGLATLASSCGWTLAHAHARTGNRFAIASYLGKKDTFDQAIRAFANAYADQNEADYARFMQALDSGELPREQA